jgi:hypothetical protein
MMRREVVRRAMNRYVQRRKRRRGLTERAERVLNDGEARSGNTMQASKMRVKDSIMQHGRKQGCIRLDRAKRAGREGLPQLVSYPTVSHLPVSLSETLLPDMSGSS